MSDELDRIAVGRRLRERRERHGRSLDDAHAALRIPVAHLAAIEEGRLDKLPEGPVRDGFVRQYTAWIDGFGGPATEPASDPDLIQVAEYVGTEPEEEYVPPPPSPIPLTAVRVIALVAAATLVILGGWQLWHQTLPAVEASLPAPAPKEAGPPDQKVSVTAEKAADLRVVVDGAVALERRVTPGETLEFEGRDRVEVDVPGAEAVKIRYNGELVSPQGRQDEPRRLVFIDDVN